MITKSRLASHPKYAVILHQYNEWLQRDGKVNSLKFFNEVIHPVFPEFHVQSWYLFVRKFKTSAGLIAAQAGTQQQIAAGSNADIALQETARTLLTNDQATQRGIHTALNLGAAFYEALWKKYNEAPETLTDFEKRCLSDSMFKAMKAQDSRIHAIGKVREDNRNQARFDHAFKNAGMDE